MFRLLLLVLLAAAAFVLVEARWSPDTLTLSLRVRTAKELVAATQGRARELGERAVEKLKNETPPVASAPPERTEPDPESLRDSDRARLNRLVEEKSRER
ncbi:MAG TPA: hypothetical protein VMR31_06925 [Myxococcota bacterium]|nr:hypothetical protein [Myxococcota bacterium]